MLVRGKSLENSMSKYLIDQIAGTSNIRVETQTEIVEAMGDTRLEALKIRSPQGEKTREATSVFLFIGAAPQTGGCRRRSCGTRMDLCCRGATCGWTGACRGRGGMIGNPICWRVRGRACLWPAMCGMVR